MGAVACDQGLRRHGATAATSFRACGSRSIWCRRCSCRCKPLPTIARPGSPSRYRPEAGRAVSNRDEQAFLVATRVSRAGPHDSRRTHAMRNCATATSRMASFSIDDLRDLQVWHKLAWMDPDCAGHDPRLTALVKRAADSRKRTSSSLRGVELELLAAVIPAYRAAAPAESGRTLHVAVLSPDPAAAVRHRCAFSRTPALARCRAGCSGGRRWPRAADYERSGCTRIFSARRAGVWPSEGIGFRRGRSADGRNAAAPWIASDEGILARSLGGRIVGRGAISAVRSSAIALGRCAAYSAITRSRISIGFSYQSWDAAAAADDFVLKVRDAARRFQAAAGRRIPW